MPSCRTSFVARFGEDQAHALDKANVMRRLIAYWREWQNMVAASPMWLPPEIREAQAASFARANAMTGDPNFD